MRWTRAAPETKALSRTAKSCGSDAPRPASSLREEAQATVPTKPGHRGEREVSRKTIARGMPGDFRCDRGDYARVLYSIAREAAGALGIRHSLRPLFSGRMILQKLGRIAPRDRGVLFESDVMARIDATKHSSPPFPAKHELVYFDDSRNTVDNLATS